MPSVSPRFRESHVTRSDTSSLCFSCASNPNSQSKEEEDEQEPEEDNGDEEDDDGDEEDEESGSDEE